MCRSESVNAFAYDLHDSVAQSILASTYQLQAIRRRIGDNPDLDMRLKECQFTLDATLGEMKHIIYALRPNVLDELGLVAALENYVGALPPTDGLATELTITGMPTPLKAEVVDFRRELTRDFHREVTRL